MGTQYLSEIRITSFNFAPKGWAMCDGQLLPINQNQALFALLGTNYGGNGQTTFALPNLKGRVPIHFGIGTLGIPYNLGKVGGEELHTLLVSEIPTHTHPLSGSSNAPQQTAPANGFFPTGGALTPYSTSSPNAVMASTALSHTGGSQPHENRPPFLTVNFVIALQGIFPSRN